ncbi:hypothetical protein DFH06DRAFT_221767 [Mycena polygramma]|nr:hypothetical protein DFH06DRAFT_221767 [Mycena polygramma]
MGYASAFLLRSRPTLYQTPTGPTRQLRGFTSLGTRAHGDHSAETERRMHANQVATVEELWQGPQGQVVRAPCFLYMKMGWVPGTHLNLRSHLLVMDSAVLHILRSFQSTRLAAVGSATVLLYDHLITIDREIDLFWRKDWSFLKCVFIFHRYLGLAGVLVELYAILSPRVTDAPGLFWFQWEMWGYTVVVLTSELLGISGAYALDIRHLQKRQTRSWGAWSAVCRTIDLRRRDPRQVLCSSASHCKYHTWNQLLLSPPRAPVLLWYWLPILVYNSAILALFIAKGTESFRSSKIPHLSRLHEVYRASFVNFLAIFVVYLVCCVLWIAGDFSLSQIPTGFALSFSITNSTRLLINIRQAYYSQEEVELDRPIYANQAPQEEWLFELRALKLG